MTTPSPRLGWFGEIYRNLGVVLSDQPDDQPLGDGWGPWTRLTRQAHQLDYEPRSLVASADGRFVAVGTKGGSVYVSQRDGDDWSPFRDLVPPTDDDEVPHVSTRALAFVGSGLLVQGLRAGSWRIFDLSGSDTEPQLVSGPPGQLRSPEAGQLHRFARAFPYAPADALDEPLAVGVTDIDALHVLSRTRDASTGTTRWDARTVSIEDCFGGFEHSQRVVGGAQLDGVTWVLGETGEILRIDGATGKQERFCVEPPVGGLRYRRIALCGKGLALLSEAYVAFVPFRTKTTDQLCELGEGPTVQSLWAHAVGAVDVAIVKDTRSDETPIVNLLLGRASDSDILIRTWWLDGTSWRMVYVPTLTRLDDQSSRFLCVGVAREGRRRWLVGAGQNGSAVIAPFLGERRVTVQLEMALRNGGTNTVLEYWHLQQMLDRSFSKGVETLGTFDQRDADVDKLLGSRDVGIGQVRALANLAIDKVLEGRPTDTRSRITAFRFWVRAALRWAHRAQIEMGPVQLGQQIVRSLHQRLVSWRPDSTEERVLVDQLRLFADLLRKWFVGGRSYGVHQVGLKKLAEINQRCGHNLDSLYYETRLLQTRTDTEWVRPSPDTRPVPTVGVTADDAGGQLILQQIATGEIRAFALDGTPLSWSVGETSGFLVDAHGRLLEEGELEPRELAGHTLMLYSLTPPSADSQFVLAVASLVRGCPGVRVVLLELNRDRREVRLVDAHLLRVGGDLQALLLLGTGDNRYVRLVVAHGSRSRARSELRSWPVSVSPAGLSLGDGASMRSQFDEAVPPDTVRGTFTSLWAWHEGGQDLVIGGLRDGRVQTFRDEASTAEDAQSWPATDEIALSGAITVMRRHVGGSDWLLAVGTEEGHVGVYLRQWEDGPKDLDQGGSPQTRRSVWRPLVLHSERDTGAASRALFFEKDGIPETDDKSLRLFALAENGSIDVFDVDVALPCRPPAIGADEYRRRRFPGLHLDRFSVGGSARAARALLAPDREGQRFIVGDDSGAIRLATVELAEATQRRREYIKAMMDRYGENASRSPDAVRPFALYVGEALEDRLAWLRLLTVPGGSLIEFSLWYELVRPLRQWVETAATTTNRLIETLEMRFEECLQRGERGYAGAKVVWTAAAWVAHRIGERVLAGDEPDEDLIDVQATLLERVDAMAQRFVLETPGVEERARIHSFRAFFDWTQILQLIDLPRSPAASRLRTAVLHMVEDRLVGTPLEVTEGISQINQALWHTLTHLGTARAGSTRRLQSGDDLEVLVSSVAAAGGNYLVKVDPGTPLSLQLVRCFALLSLLCQEDAILVALIFSSHSLFQGPALLQRSVLTEMRRLEVQLQLSRKHHG